MNSKAVRKTQVSGLVILMLFLVATLSANQNNGGASPNDASQATSIPYESLKWQAIVPALGKDSPEMAILRVDPKTQATQLLIRTPTKMHVPAHWHSANETHTMIKGNCVFEHDGERSELGPGGFNYMPAKMPHQAWSSEGAVVLITVDGAWDVNWVGDPPRKNDLGQAPPSASK
jgi:quercetin dioxygenase-like cupin family protein